jgi:hypothetical protein
VAGFFVDQRVFVSMDGVGWAGSIPVLRSFDLKVTGGPAQPTSEYLMRSGTKLSTPIRADQVIPAPFETRVEVVRTAVTALLFSTPLLPHLSHPKNLEQ